MELAKKIGPKKASLVVSGEASLREIGAVHEALLDALNASKGRVEVDISAAEKGGLPLLQLLASARCSLAEQGRELCVIASDGHPLVAVAAAAGLWDAAGFSAGEEVAR